MADSLISGSGSGTREWREDFKLTDASGNSILKVPQIPAAGEMVINDGSVDMNFRVESNGNANAIFVDAGNDRVGILTAAPAATLDVTGDVLISGTLTAGAVVDGGGAVALSSTLDVAGDFSVATNKMTVAAASGNTSIAGTANVVGDFSVATNKLTVAAASGNTVVAGTLGVTGALTASALVKLAGIETALTAHAGGGQADALALSATKVVHVVTVVGTDADSVKLPAATGSGALHLIMNADAAQDIQVFGQDTETINGVASATGVAIGEGKSALFMDYAAGLWFMLLGA